MTINFDEALTSGGSERGIHSYITAAACPRKSRLAEEAREAANGAFWPAIGRDSGSCFHLLAALYHMQLLSNDWRDDWVCELHEAAALEGIRMFEFYQDFIPVDHWGTPIAAEVPLDSRNCDGDWPEWLTGSIDLATRVNQQQADNLMSVVGAIVEPGVHILDWKTMGQKRQTLHTEMAFALQFRGYTHLWNTTKDRPKEDMVKGIFVPCVVRHKKMTTNSFVPLYVDPPGEEEVKQLFQFLVAAEKHRKTDFANLSQCFSPGPPIYGPCPYMGNVCDWENK